MGVIPGDEALGKSALWSFLEKWPSPQAAIKADGKEIADVLAPLGQQHKKTKVIKKFSGECSLYL